MSALSAADRTKLAKLLSMLSSSHAGERDAAALAATRFVQSRYTTWSEVLKPTAGKPLDLPKPFAEINVWRQTVDRCLQRKGSLRVWEIEFLCSLPSFPRLSAKQRLVLKDIADRVLAGGAA